MAARLRGCGNIINLTKLENYINGYEKGFLSQRWEEERYKWVAVEHFKPFFFIIDEINRGNRISVKTLDLNTAFAGIAAQLDGIVEAYFGEGQKKRM